MGLETKKILSISDLVRETGIPQKSLTLLLEHHGEAIPSLMDGDRRRYTPEAVPALLRFWRVYKRGIKEDRTDRAWFDETLETIRKSGEQLAAVAATLRAVQAELRRNPPQRVFYVNDFPGDLQPKRALAVHVDTLGTKSRAILLDADLEAYGETDIAAVMNLREVILRTYLRLEREAPQEEDAEQLSVLSSLITREEGIR